MEVNGGFLGHQRVPEHRYTSLSCPGRGELMLDSLGRRKAKGFMGFPPAQEANLESPSDPSEKWVNDPIILGSLPLQNTTFQLFG